ncbi:acyltransferase family protein [Streptomyces decoyicus]|uniref:acyltransferase family protein n=1 Tax=Streptomyces decoyicus TaxID=249567 RepID=UPI00386840F6
MPTSTLAPRSHRHSRRTPGQDRAHIAPLDGLRGVAVLAVLLFHAGHLGGGFLGVDLFFVLSGFLITGLLLKEATHTGKINLIGFWGRRARRLLPALTVMGVGSLLLTWAFGSPAQLGFALDDAPWVAAQMTNWHFISEHIGYWNAAGSRVYSHLWSIAVEWQFYLVWPLVVAVLARGRSAGRRLTAVAAAGALASLACMVVLPHAIDSTRVYEGTDTRAFSLLLGSLAATAPARKALAPLRGRPADILCGLLACGLGASWFLIEGESSPSLFSGGLFLHSLAAAVLIALLAGSPEGRVGRILGSAVPRRLGDLSYSIYLWHWPLYVLLPREVLGFGGWPRTAVLITLSLAAAVLSKMAVEDPIRFRARWATGRTGLVVLTAGTLAAAALWVLIPRPELGAHSVDVTRLNAPTP